LSLDIWSTIDKAFISKIVGFDFVRSKVMSLNNMERINSINMILDALLNQELISEKSLPGLERITASSKNIEPAIRKKASRPKDSDNRSQFPFLQNQAAHTQYNPLYRRSTCNLIRL
jgi:hypothetical protein